MTRRLARIPRPAVIALAATGRFTCCDIAVITPSATATAAVTNNTRSMKSNDSHALKFSLSSTSGTATPKSSATSPMPRSIPNHGRNMMMKSAMPETAAISSPVLSLLASIKRLPSVEPLIRERPSRGRASHRTHRAAYTRQRRDGNRGGRRVPPEPDRLSVLRHPRVRRFERVREQHRDRHRPHASRHGGDRPGDFAHRLEGDVADQAVFGAIRAHVDHGRAGLYHLGTDQPRRTHGGDEHVGAAADLRQVSGPRMTDGDGRV